MSYKNKASIEELAKRLKSSSRNQTYTIDLQQGVIPPQFQRPEK